MTLFARLYDRLMQRTEEACLREWRGELLEGLSGSVLEIGSGTGANLPFYKGLDDLYLHEPDEGMRRVLTERLGNLGLGFPVSVKSGVAESIPFEDGTFDFVVSTLVLCTVLDLHASLGEIRRVLKPGGEFRFIEHVVSEDTGRRRWQEALNPVWKYIAGGCNACRDTERAIVDAGFQIQTITHQSLRKALPIVRPSIRGAALAPS